MLKEKSPKMKGCVCNVSIDKAHINCNLLPRPADSNGIATVKLKRKTVCNLLFEPVRSSFLRSF